MFSFHSNARKIRLCNTHITKNRELWILSSHLCVCIHNQPHSKVGPLAMVYTRSTMIAPQRIHNSCIALLSGPMRFNQSSCPSSALLRARLPAPGPLPGAAAATVTAVVVSPRSSSAATTVMMYVTVPTLLSKHTWNTIARDWDMPATQYIIMATTTKRHHNQGEAI